MLVPLLEERYPKTVTLRDSSQVTVRPLVSSDKNALFRFFTEIPTEDLLYLKDDVTREEVVATWCRHIDYEQVLPLLALDGETIVADATLHQQKRGWMSHVGQVRVVVHPRHRRQGLATRLLGELIETATEIGLDKLVAELMGEQKEAIKVMENLGFEKAAVFPHHVRDIKGKTRDLIVMVYTLTLEEETFAAQ